MTKVYRQISRGKKWSCSQCGTKFSNRATLKIHSRSHTGKKAHECDVCKRTFLVERSLQLHMKTHLDSPQQSAGPKKYFLENEEHVKLNSRERSYKCELCLHLFPKRDAITKHLKQIHRIFNEDVHRKHITFLMPNSSKPESPAAHGIQSQKSIDKLTPEKHYPDTPGDISKINSPISNMELFISQLELVPMRPIDTSGTSDLGKAPTPRPPELEHPPSSVGPREVMYMRGFEDSESHVVSMTIGNDSGEKESDEWRVSDDAGGYLDTENDAEISRREWAKLNRVYRGQSGIHNGDSDAEQNLDDDNSLDTYKFNRSTDRYLRDVTSYDDPAFKTAMRIAEETSKQFAEMMNWNSLYNLYDSKNELNVSTFTQEEVWQFLQSGPQDNKPVTRGRRRRRKNTPTKISNPKALGRVTKKASKPKRKAAAPKSTKPKRKGTTRIIPRKKYQMKCHICEARFPDEVTLNDHLKRHVGTQTNYVKCKRCPKVFSTKYSLANHERIHSKYRPYHCKVCNKGFYQKANIKVHMRSHTGERPYKCEICGKAYSVKISLAHHSGSHPENRFACSRCKFCFQKAEELEEHMKVHAIQKSHECPKCSKTFMKAYLLEFHLQRGCKDKKFTCHHCHKQFGSLDDLKRHYRVHTGEKPFGCEICGKYFSQAANLKTHLKIHNNIRPWACDFCPATFIEKAAMQAHRRSHTGEKPHMCDICGAAFSSRSSIVIHMRKHTGEKPYACEMCEKRFISSSKLRDHYYYHHTADRPYKKRNKNDKSFAIPNGLVRSSLISTVERPFKCTVCRKQFVTKNRLTRHLTVVHKQNRDNMNHLLETQDTLSRDSHASMDSHTSHTSHASHASHASHMSHDHHMHQQHQHQHYQHHQHQHHQHLQPLQAHQQQPQPLPQPQSQSQLQPLPQPQSQPQPQQGNMMNMPGFTVAPQPMFGYGYLY